MDNSKDYIILSVAQVRELARMVLSTDSTLLLDAIKMTWPIAQMGPGDITRINAGQFADYVQMLLHAGMSF